jgi:hypothetical protein
MRSFKEQSLSDRLEQQNKARQAILEKFKARPGPDDPEVVKRNEERARVAEARAIREQEKAERKAKEDAERKAKEAAEKAERERAAKRAAIEAVIRGEAILAEQKAKRDMRYAARKARSKANQV